MAHALREQHYGSITAHERFALMVEAMARRDDREADRLEDTCPQLTYRGDDQQFRARMRMAYRIASTVCLNMRSGLAQLRMARAFEGHARDLADAGITRVVQAAFLYGRSYGQWEAGAIGEVGVPDAEQLADETAANPDLGRQLQELREVAGDGLRQVADAMRVATVQHHAADLLSQWEGFGRFCRDVLGVEALTVARGFGLVVSDPSEEVWAAYPGVGVDEVSAAAWAQRWVRSWRRRLD